MFKCWDVPKFDPRNVPTALIKIAPTQLAEWAPLLVPMISSKAGAYLSSLWETYLKETEHNGAVHDNTGRAVGGAAGTRHPSPFHKAEDGKLLGKA